MPQCDKSVRIGDTRWFCLNEKEHCAECRFGTREDNPRDAQLKAIAEMLPYAIHFMPKRAEMTKRLRQWLADYKGGGK